MAIHRSNTGRVWRGATGSSPGGSSAVPIILAAGLLFVMFAAAYAYAVAAKR